ncbi:hypothetical protein HGRIS_011517 [Hohenbuehelia grisea]|uniref:Protoporphyrinogen oxidase n=1 Tax=Hohenbuehelia grisea TaxID=104357 RepID=A0ABR3JWE3_9AGAR
MPPRHIAVLGGGLTGLSAAFHLVRRFPTTKLTLLEQKYQLGGWAQSERVEVRDDAGTPYSILLEAGPRTLRPNANSMLELIHLLGLKDSVIRIPKTAPAARRRFLHIPGTKGLTPLPSSIPSVLSSSLRSTFIEAFRNDFFRRGNRPDSDESLDSFMTRRFGESPARLLGSSLVHGIYAADSRLLSVRAAFPSLLDAEDRGNGSVIRGMLRASQKSEHETYDVGDIRALMEYTSVYSFRDGLSTITAALAECLKGHSHVRLQTGISLKSLNINTDGSFELSTSANETIRPTHVVSALPLPKLQAILPSAGSLTLPHLTHNPISSVKVVNFVFPSSTSFHPAGFGYLIPRPEGGYDVPGNPGILGTVFDSCALEAQDSPTSAFTNTLENNARPPIKVTMMLGGPYSRVLSEDVSFDSLLSHLSAHLQRVVPDPLHARMHHHKDCLPTPTPGHLTRMAELKEVLEGGPWQGRLEVIGAGVGGASVGDCVEAGRRVGRAWS